MSRRSTKAAVTALQQQVQHLKSRRSTAAAVAALQQQLQHLISSYSTAAAVTALQQQLQHYSTVTAPHEQSPHCNSSNSTSAAVPPEHIIHQITPVPLQCRCEQFTALDGIQGARQHSEIQLRSNAGRQELLTGHGIT